MISFSPTQKKAGKVFYSESSSPVQWTDLPKNDYKLNDILIRLWTTSSFSLQDYNCFLQSRKQLLILLYPNSQHSVVLCLPFLSRTQLNEQLPWTIQIMEHNLHHVVVMHVLGAEHHNYYCQHSLIEIDSRRFSLMRFTNVTPLYFACIYCVTLRSYTFVYGKASSWLISS